MPKHTKVLCLLHSVLWVSPLWGQDLVANSELNSLDYYKFWQAQLPLRAGERVIELHRVDENLYAITDQAVLYAVHADVGTIRWSTRLGGPGNRVFRPSHVRSFWGKDLAVVTASDRIQWIDRSDGAFVANLSFDFVPSTPAVSDGVRVYVAGLDFLLHCFQIVPEGKGVGIIERWQVRTEGLTVSSPVLWGGGLFFASQDGRVRAGDARDKSRLWVFNAGSPIAADIHADSTGVYFGAEDRCVYKLNVETGQGVWRFRTPGIINAAPVLIGDLLLQRAEGHGIYAIDVDKGEQVWHAPTAREFISASGDSVNLLTHNRDIIVVNSKSVDIEAQVFAGEVELVAGNVGSAAMYLGNSRGAILCAQPRSVPYLRFEQLQAVTEPGPSAPSQKAESREESSSSATPSLTDLLRSKSEAPPLGG